MQKELSALVIPTRSAELEVIVANFSLWNKDEHLPYVELPTNRFPLVLSINSSRDIEFEEKVQNAYNSCSRLKQCFSSLTFIYCKLSGENDLYTRSDMVKLGSYGKVSGPNLQFFLTMSMLKELSGAVLYLETDVIPVKPNWLLAIHKEIEAQDSFWVLGSHYFGLSQLKHKEASHLNGNAIYAVGDPNFQLFLQDSWKPFLVEQVSKFSYTAYDSVIPLLLSKIEKEYQDNSLGSLSHLFRTTALISNYSGSYEKTLNDGIRIQEILSASPDTVLVHGAYILGELNVEPDGRDNKMYYKQLEKTNRGNEDFNWKNLNRVYPTEYYGKSMREQLVELYRERLLKLETLDSDCLEYKEQLDELAILLHRIAKQNHQGAGDYKDLLDHHVTLDSQYGKRLLRLAKEKKLVLTLKEKLNIVLTVDANIIDLLVSHHSYFCKTINSIDAEVKLLTEQLLGEDIYLEKVRFDRSYAKPKNKLAYFAALSEAINLDKSETVKLIDIYFNIDNMPRVAAFTKLRKAIVDEISVAEAVVVTEVIRGNL